MLTKLKLFNNWWE